MPHTPPSPETPLQSFDVTGGPDYGRRHLPMLRQEMKRLELDVFLVPHEDEYQNEYLPACHERLMWISGFTGSAGAALILKDSAVLFVDGRYSLQARQQVDAQLFDYAKIEDGGMIAWLRTHLDKGAVVGYDPRLHSETALSRLKSAVKSRGSTLKPLAINPIDTAWADRPDPPCAPLTIQPLKLAGTSHQDKCKDIAANIIKIGADAALITAPASIAWLLNIRGADVQCSPLPLSTAIIDSTGKVQLFIAPEKISPPIVKHLGKQVDIQPESDLLSAFGRFKTRTLIIDPNTASAWHVEAARHAGASVKLREDPIALPKACKNAAEITGTKAAHIRDGSYLVNFLHWLDSEAQSGEFDEIEAAQKLESFRRSDADLKDLSFETISAAGANGALPHYRVTQNTVTKLSKGTLYLVDSGGQYPDGTTDVTRTVPIGMPSDEMRRTFTLVLKGHIALAEIRFPQGTTGSNLDVLARQPLWQAGLDFDHGTGHGVGVFLGVHEGPQRISKRPNGVALRPGMIVSNEPGYYKEGAFGIRIENLQFVTPPAPITNGGANGEREMLGFETLTFAPIHKDLILLEIMSPSDIEYMDRYHATVLEKIGPLVSGDVRDWLVAACAPLSRN